ncbi:IclR family transcriptional regulator [Pseudonocardia ailaonensis]|uniref:IclR family transcriptional regulator n=1 Tax=Pseudonocardia ailaonensis TaxID=367279 RepID=A0ABN2MRP2_9PSEU
MASDVPAVMNAVRLLERIARAWPDPVATGVLIDDLGLNRSTAYNILGTLRRAGWAATRDDRAGWWLGPRLLTLAGTREDWLGELVQSEIDELARLLGHLVFAVRQTGPGEYSVLARADLRQGVRITVGLGDTFPFSAPAIMRAFHAWLPADEVERAVARHGLTAFTGETVVDHARLHQVLAEVRANGYASSVREYDPGQSGISAPVFDDRGAVTLALVSLAFSSELDKDTVPKAGELIRESGLRLTERIGGVAPAHRET